MPRVIVFDVNETLLDLRALDPLFDRLFGDSQARERWFSQVLQTALVSVATRAYADFATVAGAALEMTAERRGVTLTDDDREAVRQQIRSLPPHDDVRESLERLRAAGLRLATLTNSPPDTLEAQLTHAGLLDLFERALSVHAVRKLKPAPEVYRMAARALGVAPHDIRLVAAHDWDVTGAMRAGCAAAFVARPGMVLGPLSEHPDIVGPDLRAVTTQIIERDAA